MSYDLKLADRVREHLATFPELEIEEKEMFRGLAFLVNGKMCINVSGQNLMCRYDPALTPELAEKTGYAPMIMKGKEIKGYCYVEPEGIRNTADFNFWMSRCLEFNERAKASKKKSKKEPAQKKSK